MFYTLIYPSSSSTPIDSVIERHRRSGPKNTLKRYYMACSKQGRNAKRERRTEATIKFNAPAVGLSRRSL